MMKLQLTEKQALVREQTSMTQKQFIAFIDKRFIRFGLGGEEFLHICRVKKLLMVKLKPMTKENLKFLSKPFLQKKIKTKKIQELILTKSLQKSLIKMVKQELPNKV